MTMPDLSAYAHRMSSPVKKTPEELRSSCLWCRGKEGQFNACQCDIDCGRGVCPQAADLLDYQAPELPRFK